MALTRSQIKSNSSSNNIVPRYGGGNVRGQLKIYDNISDDSTSHWHLKSMYSVGIEYDFSSSSQTWSKKVDYSTLRTYQDKKPETRGTLDFDFDGRYYPALPTDIVYVGSGFADLFQKVGNYNIQYGFDITSAQAISFYGKDDGSWEQGSTSINYRDLRQLFDSYSMPIVSVDVRGKVTVTYDDGAQTYYATQNQEQVIVPINRHLVNGPNGGYYEANGKVTVNFQLASTYSENKNAPANDNVRNYFDYVSAIPSSSIRQINTIKMLTLRCGPNYPFVKQAQLPGTAQVNGVLKGQGKNGEKVQGDITIYAFLKCDMKYTPMNGSYPGDGTGAADGTGGGGGGASAGGGTITIEFMDNNLSNSNTDVKLVKDIEITTIIPNSNSTSGGDSNSNTHNTIEIVYFEPSNSTSTHLTDVTIGASNSTSIIVSNSDEVITNIITNSNSTTTIIITPKEAIITDIIAIQVPDESEVVINSFKAHCINFSDKLFITPHNLNKNPTMESNGFVLNVSSVNGTQYPYLSMGGNPVMPQSHYASLFQTNPWYEIKLNEAKRLHGLVIFSRNSGEQILKNVTLQGSNDGINYVNICDLSINNGISVTLTLDIEETINDAVKPYQYWRIQADGQGYLVISQIEFQFETKHTIWEYNPSEYAQLKGYNHYENSFIDQYINNSTSNFEYQPQTRWSKNSNSLYLSTNKTKGLLYGMDSEFCQGLLETEIPVNNNGIYPYDNHQTINRKVFIPSLNELGGSSQGFFDLGTPFAFFNSNSSYIERRVRYITNAQNYWTRTIRYVPNSATQYRNAQRIVKGSAGNPPGSQGYTSPNASTYFCPVTRWGTDKSSIKSLPFPDLPEDYIYANSVLNGQVDLSQIANLNIDRYCTWIFAIDNYSNAPYTVLDFEFTNGHKLTLQRRSASRNCEIQRYLGSLNFHNSIVDNGQFHYISCVLNDSTISVYVDFQLIGTKESDDYYQNIQISKIYAHTIIKDFRVYNRALEF